MKNREVLHTVKEDRNTMYNKKKRKANLIGCILHTFLKEG